MEKKERSKTEASASLPQTQHDKPQLPFRFLDLPAELRIAIYEYAFEKSTTVLCHGARLDGRNYHFIQEDPSGQPYHTGLAPLLVTSKQVRAEAIEIFFARTKFIVSGLWIDVRLKVLMRKLGPQRSMAISRLCWRRFSEGFRAPTPKKLAMERAKGRCYLEDCFEHWGLKGIVEGGLQVEILGE